MGPKLALCYDPKEIHTMVTAIIGSKNTVIERTVPHFPVEPQFFSPSILRFPPILIHFLYAKTRIKQVHDLEEREQFLRF